MALLPVTWAFGDVATSAKLAQMVENLRVHDHWTADQGKNLGARSVASGVATGVAPSLAANANGTAVVNLPVGRFANPPRVYCSIVGAQSQGRRVAPLSDPSATTFTIGVANGATAVPAGGLSVAWIAVDAP